MQKLGNLLQRYESSQLLVVLSVVWSVLPGVILKQKIHFAVLMLKSSFNFLGATMKFQKWSKSEALGSNYTFKDGLAEYYTFFFIINQVPKGLTLKMV